MNSIHPTANECRNQKIHQEKKGSSSGRTYKIYYSEIPTNLHFELVDKLIIHISQKLIDKSLTKKEFEWGTSQYLKVLQINLKNQELGKEIIKNVKELMLYDKQTNKEILPQDPCIIALLIEEFFRKSIVESESIFELSKKIKFCLTILGWIKFNVNYLPEQQKKAHHFLRDSVFDKLTKIENGKALLLPGGWCKVYDEGHFMLYLIERVDKTNYIKRRINSHIYLESESKEIQINSSQNIEIHQLYEFLDNLFTLQFPQTLIKTDFHLLDPEQKINFCDKYSPQESDPIFMEGQNLNNCAFMAFNALYFLLESDSGSNLEFQHAFRLYLDNFTN
jgi:hypothetical protein